MTDWNKIETDIKTDSNDWDRFAFLAEQVGHAYINLFVELGRKHKISKPWAKGIAYVTLITPISIILGIISQIGWNKSDDTSTV